MTSNFVAIYPDWSFNIEKLAPRKLKSPIVINLYETGSNLPHVGQVLIQTEHAFSIEFDMVDVPVDNQGCYVKYTFPQDIALPDAKLTGYQSSKEPGEAMMLSATGSRNLI